MIQIGRFPIESIKDAGWKISVPAEAVDQAKLIVEECIVRRARLEKLNPMQPRAGGCDDPLGNVGSTSGLGLGDFGVPDIFDLD